MFCLCANVAPINSAKIYGEPRRKKVEKVEEKTETERIMDKVYEFWYNECIYESAAQCMSLHRTQKGAEMAMEYHKNDIYKV